MGGSAGRFIQDTIDRSRFKKSAFGSDITDPTGAKRAAKEAKKEQARMEAEAARKELELKERQELEERQRVASVKRVKPKRRSDQRRPTILTSQLGVPSDEETAKTLLGS